MEERKRMKGRIERKEIENREGIKGWGKVREGAGRFLIESSPLLYRNNISFCDN